jgi:hypothetical protein
LIDFQPRSHQYSFAAVRGFWRRALLGCYALLFAAVFPFVCWGGLSGEDHPHLLPHFVFFEPTSHTHNVATTPVRHTHTATIANQPSYEPATDHPPVMPAGRAAPAMLIFSLVLLLMGASLLVLYQTRPLFLMCQAPLFFVSIFLTVPHPPPRLI